MMMMLMPVILSLRTKYTVLHPLLLYYYQSTREETGNMDNNWRLQTKKGFDSLPHAATTPIPIAALVVVVALVGPGAGLPFCIHNFYRFTSNIPPPKYRGRRLLFLHANVSS